MTAPELSRPGHEPHRLPISLRMRHSEVAVQVFLGVAAFLMPDDHDARAVQPRPAPTIAGSSRNSRSPCSSTKSVNTVLT